MQSESHRLRSAVTWVAITVLAALGGALSVGVASAFAADSASPTASTGGNTVLRVGWVTEPDSLNPLVGYEQSSYELYHLEYDFLTDFGRDHLETEPGLATDWSHSADGLTWTFKIRQGVKWQDGVPLTASDIAFTYNVQVTSQRGFMSYLRGIKRAYAKDDYTLIIKCARPKADILAMWVPILPEHIWGKFKTWDQIEKFQNKPPVIGTGPFQIVKWVKGQYVECVANEDYWGGSANVDELLFDFYTNASTMVDDLKSGNLQLAIDVPPAQLAQLKSDPDVDAEACDVKGFDYLTFNCYKGASSGNPVLRDVRFRQALNWAIDKDKIVSLAYSSYASAGVSVFQPDFYDPDTNWYWQPAEGEGYSFDLSKAKSLLAAAGYKDSDGDGILNDPYHGDKNIVLRLWARSESLSSQTAGKLITSWFTSLGLKINFTVHDNSVLSDGVYTYDGDTYKPDFDMYIWSWLPSGSDPQGPLSYFTTGQIEGSSDSCWSNTVYDALYELQGRTLDQQKRKQIVWKMEKMLYENSPYVVLAYPKQLEAWNTSSWSGWVRIPEKVGAPAYISDNVDNYSLVSQKTGDVSDTGGASTTSIVVLVCICGVAVVALIVILVRRARSRSEEV